MINRKISSILGPLVGIMGFMLTVGMIEVPVFAEEKIQSGATEVVNTTGAESTDYFTNVNKSITQNGIKVTIDKVAGAKHKFKIIVKVESDKPFDEKKSEDLEEIVTYGNSDVRSESMSYSQENDKTLVITTEQENEEEGFPEKGTVRVDLVIPEYKVNVGIDADVDFTEAYKNTIEKDISTKLKISDKDITLDKLEANTMGTTISYSGCFTGNDVSDYRVFHESVMILKIGDKMYKMRSSGSSARGNGGNTIIKGEYENEAVTYEKIKDQESIGIIPIVSEMTNDDMKEAMKEYEEGYKKGVSTKDLINNIGYSPTFAFNDGTEGKIYNIERSDNGIKIYCKGTSLAESLLMVSSMHLSYDYLANKNEFINYDSDKNMSFYKDPKDSLGYIVEFDNIQKDKALNLYIDSSIRNIDKFKVGDEIQVSK